MSEHCFHDGNADQRRESTCRYSAAACAVLLAAMSGCAAFTNPVANGVPVRMLPDELLGESREGYEPIDLALLRRDRPEQFQLDTGDTLGIYVEGIIGDESTPPPVNLPASTDQPPSIGYPFPVRSDGTVSLPLVGAVEVSGMTVEEAEAAVAGAYLKREIVRPEDFRIIVSLLRPRTVRVLVVREDGGQPQVTLRSQGLRGLGSTSTTIGGGNEATGEAIDLPIYENDLLTALTRTGGVPNAAATEEIVIYRGRSAKTSTGQDVECDTGAGCDLCNLADREGGEIRIPLRKKCEETVCISKSDVVLRDGDIVTVRSRVPELFYTGGLLPSSEQQVPFDYDLRVVEAVLRSQGPLVNGGINSSNLNGSIVGVGIGNPSPSQLSLLRHLPNGQQVNIHIDLNDALRDPRSNILVQANDVLILQENRDEALTRYFYTSVFRIDSFFRFINRTDAQASASFVLP